MSNTLIKDRYRLCMTMIIVNSSRFKATQMLSRS